MSAALPRWLRIWAKACAPLLVYVPLAMLAIFPALFGLPERIPTLPGGGPTDYYHFHWNYGWIREALAHGWDVYSTNRVMAPATSSLALHTLTPFWYPLWALIEPVAGTAAGMAAILIASTSFAGWTTYHLLRAEGAAAGLALAGGAMFQLSAIFMVGIHWTNINLMGWGWLPLMALVWRRIVLPPPRLSPTRGRRKIAWSFLLGACAWALLLTDVQYTLFAPFFLLPYALVTAWRALGQSRTVANRVQGNVPGSKSLCRKVVAIPRRGINPSVWPQAANETPVNPLQRVEGGKDTGGFEENITPGQMFGRWTVAAGLAVITAVALLWAVGPLRPLLAYDRSTLAPTPAERAVSIEFPACYLSRCEADVSLGYLILPLLVISIFVYAWQGQRQREERTRGLWVWPLIALLPLVLTLGAATPLYRALHAALGGQFRYPERFAPLFLLPALLFACGVWSPVLRRWERGGRILLTAPLMLIVFADARVFRPLNTNPLPAPYAEYARMASDPQDYVVLDVPTTGMSGEGIAGDSRWVQTQFYALMHGKRVTNGHISRVNTWHYMYMETSDPMMAWLGGRRYLEPQAVRAQLIERLRDWPIGYLAVHERWIDPTTLTEVTGFLNAQTGLLCPPMREDIALNGDSSTVDGGALFYRARALGCRALTSPDVLPIGDAGDTAFIGWGWYAPETAGGLRWRWLGAPPYAGADAQTLETWQNRAVLYVTPPPDANAITVDVQAFATPRTLTLFANGLPLGTPQTVLPDALQSLTYPLDPDLNRDGVIELAFVVDGTTSPQDAGVGDDARQLGIALNEVRFSRINPP